MEAALAATGFEEVSLLSLSIGDYGPLTGLLQSLMDRLSPAQVAVSLPSMRADTLTPEMMAQIKRVRRTGLTLAPEAGTQRLRQVINKNLTEAAIMDSAQRAFAAGWQLLKLYFMIGLPRETKEDREGITALARQILAAAPRGSRPRLNVSLSSFIPKPHTPFQWERQEDLEECRRRLHEVKDRLRQKNIQTKWNSAAQTWLEGVFSRGDRRLAPVLLEAHRRGCRLDAWSEHMRLEPWREAFQATGVDPDFYLRERPLDELLPWDHVDCGVSRDFLLAERARADQGLETPDCRGLGLPGLRRLRPGPDQSQAGGLFSPAPGAAAVAAAGPRPAGALPLPADLRQAGGGPLAGAPGDGGLPVSQPAPLRVAPGVLVRISSPAPGLLL